MSGAACSLPYPSVRNPREIAKVELFSEARRAWIASLAPGAEVDLWWQGVVFQGFIEETSRRGMWRIQHSSGEIPDPFYVWVRSGRPLVSRPEIRLEPPGCVLS
jgi:hypothetical protein